MTKTINRTFTVKTGKELIADYENRTFEEREVTIFDSELVPPNVRIESVVTIRASMPVDKFFELADKKVIGEQQAVE